MLSQKEVKRIRRLFLHITLADIIEKIARKLKEIIFGVDCKVFSKTIEYYLKEKNKKFSCSEALKKSLNKEVHKKAWFKKERKNVDDIFYFYKEVDIYPFRQHYLRRFGGFRWYRRLVDHFKKPSILEYGCGSAALTEWFTEKFPECKYTVADIPSATLDFIRWKKKNYGYNYEILEIGKGKEGIPLKEKYDFIICQDVLEHTPNPLEIVESFCSHMSENGILIIDFMDRAEGENLYESMKQRETVKKYLKNNFYSIKAIDKPKGNGGVYLKTE
ncbi:MAG: class I SAM-dependent methyltransferase [Patescibacteria group bacterium]